MQAPFGIMPQGYPYQMPTRGGGMMMPTQGWGVMPAQRPVKSTTATRKTAQQVRKRSDGKIRVLMSRLLI